MRRRIDGFLLRTSMLIAIGALILLPVSCHYAASLSYVGRSTSGNLGIGGGQIAVMRQFGPGMADLLSGFPDDDRGKWYFNGARDRTHYFDFNRYWLRAMRPHARFAGIPRPS